MSQPRKPGRPPWTEQQWQDYNQRQAIVQAAGDEYNAKRGMGRRDFLKKAGSLGAAAGLGALAASMGLPASGIPANQNWTEEGGSNNQDNAYLIFTDGTKWFRRNGITGQNDDTSVSDSPITDPVPLINRAISALGAHSTNRITVKGDFTTNGNTINIGTQQTVSLSIYGEMTQSGNAPAFKVDDAQTGYSDYGFTGPEIYARGLTGPYGVSGAISGFANSAGIQLVNSMQRTYRFGHIQGFQYGILVDNTALGDQSRTVINDNQFHTRTLYNNNYSVRFKGPPFGGASGTVQCQGNEWFLQVIAPVNGLFGVVKDANLFHQLQQWYHLSFVPAGGSSGFWIANPGRHDNIAAISGDYILALYWVDNVNNLLQPDDVLVAQNNCTIAGSGDAGAFGGQTRVAKLGLGQKQLAVALAAGTSKAVTFPMIEFDTNYSVIPTFDFNAGAWFVDTKSTSGCTIHWANAANNNHLDYMLYR